MKWKSVEFSENQYNFLFVEDALYANAPHIEQLQENGFDYLLNVKPNSHKTLFACIEGKRKRKELKNYKVTIDGITHEFEYINNVLLCDSSPNLRVNYLQYTQTDKKGKKTTFTWITNIKLTKNKLFALMRAGRSRWKIENETFIDKRIKKNVYFCGYKALQTFYEAHPSRKGVQTEFSRPFI